MQRTDGRAKNSDSMVTRECHAGALRGCCDNGMCGFFGVPYAAPPVGENRFREPQPVEPWQGLRDATRAGSSAPYKIPDFPQIDIVPLVGPGGSGGEDYLGLNIWAPEKADGHPVMVWIHGGAFAIGTK